MNLDCMSADELRAYAVTATGKLREYAEVKARAMDYRSAGKITEALRIECQCDRIYDRLTDNEKW